MANKQYSSEQAGAKLRQIDVLVGEGKSIHLRRRHGDGTKVTDELSTAQIGIRTALHTTFHSGKI